MPRPPVRVAILAGGSGTRFWPLGRAARPKQVLALDGADARPLLRATLDRVRPLDPRPLVVAPRALGAVLRRSVGRASVRWLFEPAPRNTAAAVLLAADATQRASPGAALLVVPADHHVAPVAAYRRALQAMAARAAATGAIVVLGIPPERPTSAYGYLRLGPVRARSGAGPLRRVERYVEKPALARARRLVADGRHVWGAGTFAFRPEALLAEATRVLPEVAEPLLAAGGRGAKALERAYARVPSISVDFGVMERARDVEALAARGLEWDDLGSFDAVARHRPADARGNHTKGDVALVEAKDCAVESEQGLVALLGVSGLIVVRTKDAVLVAPRGRGEEVRKVVAALAARGRKDVL